MRLGLIKKTLVKTLLAVLILGFSVVISLAQESGFPFGKITYQELNMSVYEKDSTASAVVLNEFGEAFFDLNELNKIVLHYHIKIKILKEEGKKFGNFEIALRKTESKREVLSDIKASTFNSEGTRWKETSIQSQNIFRENASNQYEVVKLALPEVRVGSVIEISYQLETPFTYNFIPWKFQTDIPKIKSEYWATYPAYYEYAITLKGYLKLSKNESRVIPKCIGSSSYANNYGADCSQFKFGIENIPAFREEDYMTTKENFLSAITFELDKITQTDGRVNKITSEWADVNKELEQHEYFGRQIKKARGEYSEVIKKLKSENNDPLLLGKSIFNHIKQNLSWTGGNGILTSNGIKKTKESKRGNVADINLSLLGALQEADLDAWPVLISTRTNGIPIKHHAVISDFNYVMVAVTVADKTYLLDATSMLYDFGFVPLKCLNGQGRTLGKNSQWIDINPVEKNKIICDFRVSISDAGEISGSGSIHHYGYSAYDMRVLYFSSGSPNEFSTIRMSRFKNLEIENYTVTNEANLSLPFIEKFEFTFPTGSGTPDIIYLESFLYRTFERNPFSFSERTYPIDFGAPLENTYILTLSYPERYQLEEAPQNIAVILPNAGGRCIRSVSKFSDKVSLTSSFSITKPVYAPADYDALKEIFGQYVAIQQTQFVFKQK